MTENQFQEEWESQPEFISSATFLGTLFIKDAEHLRRVRPDVALLGIPLEWGE